MSNLGFPENGIKVLQKRNYLLPGEDVEAMLHRVASCVAKGSNVPAYYEPRFFGMMAARDFLPNTPTLMNAGKPGGQLSACFVLGIEDNMESIFTTLKDAAMIHKSGGGTGFSFSNLRPKNAKVKSTNGIASGPVSFMRIFNAATKEIKQGGARRGANMGVMRIDHPDILEFMTCKENDADLNEFNISVAVTDAFMQRVKAGEMFPLVDPHTKEVVELVEAQKMWNTLCERAWKNGDPGVLFIDTVNAANPTPHLGDIKSTNPCGEQPLLSRGESCNLGSINLSNFVVDGEFDFERLKEVAKLATVFLDSVIEVNTYPLPKIEKATKDTRKIGLGVMGFADTLIALEIPYDTEEAREFAERVMKTISKASAEESIALGKLRGPYPEDVKETGFRNAARTTQAPTGTISMVAGCWGGIEPLFAISYEKHVMEGDVLFDVAPAVLKYVYDNYIEEDAAKIIKELTDGKQIEHTSLKHKKHIFRTAQEIKPIDHLKMQAAFQRHVDSAISKTINLPNSATVDDIKEVYMSAWEMGLKGVTVYRDGCKANQVYYKKEAGKEVNTSAKVPQQGNSIVIPDNKVSLSPKKVPTPEVAQGIRIRKKTGCGMLYTHFYTNDDGKPIEIFADLGKAGGCPAAFTEGIGRIASLALKRGTPVEDIRDELMEIKCYNACGLGPKYVASCLDGIGKAIHDYLQMDITNNLASISSEDMDPQIAKVVDDYFSELLDDPKQKSGACPECGGTLDYVEGCRGGKCRNPACSYYTCG